MVMTTSERPIKHIELTHQEWDWLRAELIKEHGPSILISWKMKRDLGFTVREHKRGFVHLMDTIRAHVDWRDSNSVICLDFYDESMKTWYLLKYSNRND
jgi:hypothetical protein